MTIHTFVLRLYAPLFAFVAIFAWQKDWIAWFLIPPAVLMAVLLIVLAQKLADRVKERSPRDVEDL
jgi:hypothetical protein